MQLFETRPLTVVTFQEWKDFLNRPMFLSMKLENCIRQIDIYVGCLGEEARYDVFYNQKINKNCT